LGLIVISDFQISCDIVHGGFLIKGDLIMDIDFYQTILTKPIRDLITEVAGEIENEVKTYFTFPIEMRFTFTPLGLCENNEWLNLRIKRNEAVIIIETYFTSRIEKWQSFSEMGLIAKGRTLEQILLNYRKLSTYTKATFYYLTKDNPEAIIEFEKCVEPSKGYMYFCPFAITTFEHIKFFFTLENRHQLNWIESATILISQNPKYEVEVLVVYHNRIFAG
jgi:hypothetical protein